MNLSDLYSGSALGGAASGAATGFMLGGPTGAVIGGLGGDLLGASANSTRNDASAAQQQNLQAGISQMHAASANAYAQHFQNLEKALAFYGPAQQQWDKLYGAGTGAPAATGQGSWKGTGV